MTGVHTIFDTPPLDDTPLGISKSADLRHSLLMSEHGIRAFTTWYVVVGVDLSGCGSSPCRGSRGLSLLFFIELEEDAC